MMGNYLKRFNASFVIQDLDLVQAAQEDVTSINVVQLVNNFDYYHLISINLRLLFLINAINLYQERKYSSVQKISSIEENFCFVQHFCDFRRLPKVIQLNYQGLLSCGIKDHQLDQATFLVTSYHHAAFFAYFTLKYSTTQITQPTS